MFRTLLLVALSLTWTVVGGRRVRPSVAVVDGRRFRPTSGHLALCWYEQQLVGRAHWSKS